MKNSGRYPWGEKERRKKIIQIGVASVIGLGVGIFAGRSLTAMKLRKDTIWNFDVINNSRLVVKMSTDNGRKYCKWTFSEGDTKQIVDDLMDKFYPGD